MIELTKAAVEVAKKIQDEANEVYKPPVDGRKPKSNRVIDPLLVKVTGVRRPYLEKIVDQINGTYENGWYDSCAVLLRRLIETLIIQAYEENDIADRITENGYYVSLNTLISRIQGEKKLPLGGPAKKALSYFKELGDLAAHSRRFNANRNDIAQHLSEIRVTVQELMSIAGLA